MNMFKSVVLLIACIELTIGIDLDSLREEGINVMTSCTKEYPISDEEFTNLTKGHTMPETGNAKCLMACAYRKYGTLDEKGMFSKEAAEKLVSQWFKDCPDVIDKSKEFAALCHKVNDEKVSDGEKGCERAALMYDCVVVNAPKFGLEI